MLNQKQRMVKIFQDRDITDAYSLVKKKSTIYAEKIKLENYTIMNHVFLQVFAVNKNLYVYSGQWSN